MQDYYLNSTMLRLAALVALLVIISIAGFILNGNVIGAVVVYLTIKLSVSTFSCLYALFTGRPFHWNDDAIFDMLYRRREDLGLIVRKSIAEHTAKPEDQLDISDYYGDEE